MKQKTFIIVSIIFTVASAILAYQQIKGWGWFLFGSLFTFLVAFNGGNSETHNDNEI